MIGRSDGITWLAKPNAIDWTGGSGVPHGSGGPAGLERGRGLDDAAGLVAGRLQGHFTGRAVAGHMLYVDRSVTVIPVGRRSYEGVLPEGGRLLLLRRCTATPRVSSLSDRSRVTCDVVQPALHLGRWPSEVRR